jgi:glycine cleavage system transcriptional repressor
VAREQLSERLDAVRSDLGLEAIAVSEVNEVGAAPNPSHVLSVYGADHPGIVHSVSSALAERGISITGLETRLAGAADAPVYVMLLEIAAGDADAGGLRTELERLGQSEGLDVSLRELTADAL